MYQHPRLSNLILFQDMLYHIARFLRAITLQQQDGHILIIGPRGIGKKTIC